MYNKEKQVVFGINTKVKHVISELSKLDPDMQLYFCGQAGGYLHVDTTNNICSFDTETDDDWYEKEGESMTIVFTQLFYCENCFNVSDVDLSSLFEAVDKLKEFKWANEGMFANLNGFICPHCGCYHSTFKIDYGMKYIIRALNEKGYATRACCSGHETSNCFHHESDEAYVYIEPSKTLEEYLKDKSFEDIYFDISVEVHHGNGGDTPNGICIRSRFKGDVELSVRDALFDHLCQPIFNMVKDFPDNEDTIKLIKYSYYHEVNGEMVPYTDKKEDEENNDREKN